MQSISRKKMDIRLNSKAKDIFMVNSGSNWVWPVCQQWPRSVGLWRYGRRGSNSASHSDSSEIRRGRENECINILINHEFFIERRIIYCVWHVLAVFQLSLSVTLHLRIWAPGGRCSAHALFPAFYVRFEELTSTFLMSSQATWKLALCLPRNIPKLL